MKAIYAVGILCIAALTFGQRNPAGITSRAMLLMDPGVSKELKLTKEQKKAIDELIQKETKAMENPGSFGSINLYNPLASVDPKIEPLLDSEQNLRLDGIFLQANLGFGLTDVRIIKALAITDDQLAIIKPQMQTEQSALMQQMMTVRSQGDAKKIKEAFIAAGEKLLALITEDQRKRYAEVCGKPYKFR